MLTLLKRLRIATKLWLLIAIFALVGLTDNLTEMLLVKDRLHAEKEIQLRHLVETTHALLQTYEQSVKAGRLPESIARAQAAEAVRQLHYGPREYFWIHDLTRPIPVMVMHPTVPTLNGRHLDDSRFDKATSMRVGNQGPYHKLAGINLFAAMNQAIAATGDGFVTYDWPKPLAAGGISERLYPKLSYVKRFDPWGWVIGSGIYIDDLETEYWSDIRLRLMKAGLWVVLLGTLAWFIDRTVVRPLRSFQGAIDELRANPNHPLVPDNERPGELGHLTHSFEGLVEDLQRSRNELTLSIEKLRNAARSVSPMNEGVIITDPGGRILAVNVAITRASGFEAEDLIGQSPAVFRSGQHDPTFYAQMWTQIHETGRWSGEIRNKTKDGRLVLQWLSIHAAHDNRGKLRGFIGLYSEVT